PEDGKPKLWLIQRTLKLRAQFPGLFQGSYEPLPVEDAYTDHVFAFMRGRRLAVVVPRFSQKLLDESMEAVLNLPPGQWRNIFTNETFANTVAVDELFKLFPVALLLKNESPG